MRNVDNIIKFKKQQGFTMLEALLTLFVLTVGILGVAGLQMRAMSSGGVAMQRTVAMMKTQEMIDRIRVNSANIATYAGTVTFSAPVTGVAAGSPQAAVDMFMWRTDIAALLPNSAATPITTTINIAAGAAAASPSTIDVLISWTEKSQAQSYTVRTAL
jgi:type IV pilus modification protein PilV